MFDIRHVSIFSTFRQYTTPPHADKLGNFQNGSFRPLDASPTPKVQARGGGGWVELGLLRERDEVVQSFFFLNKR